MRGSWLLGPMLALCIALPSTLRAAEPATLIADSVAVEGDGRLVASGHVEIFYGEQRLTASRVEYDEAGERLSIAGPIQLQSGEDAILFASEAELSADLREGILRSARLVLARQMQLTAAEIVRANGRYVELSRTIASTCRICSQSETPLWEIRAQRVLHDQQEHQLYFDHAQLRVAGIPVFYVPRLRLPDPSLKRATGFLLPQLRTTSQLGAGVKVPYFVVLSDYSDVLITPYLSPRTKTLELEYRRNMENASLRLTGAGTYDDLSPDGGRGYLFGEYTRILPREFRLNVNLELASDPAYLLDYDYSDKDRLQSYIQLSRARRSEYFDVSYSDFRTLRDADLGAKSTLPDSLIDLRYQRRLSRDIVGGDLWLGLDASTLRRSSTTNIEGRDTSRTGVSLDWRRGATLSNGMVIGTELGTSLQFYTVEDDSNFDPSVTRITERAGLTIGWPLQRFTAGGDTQLLEPVAQLAWADARGAAVPNEDSLTSELDEGNLFSLSRFPGLDRYETGLRANLGIVATHLDASGWSVTATMGRVFRLDGSDSQFGTGSGLAGTRSDWLAAIRIAGYEGFSLSGRALIQDNLEIGHAETRFGWSNDRASIAATYVRSVAEPDEGLTEPLSELSIASSYVIRDNWTTGLDWRYDIETDRMSSAALEIGYRTDCLNLLFSVGRRYTASDSVEPSTSASIRVSLGSGAPAGTEQRIRQCMG